MKRSNKHLIGMSAFALIVAGSASHAAAEDVDPAAIEAVKAMAEHLRELDSFEIEADVAYDGALPDGELVQRNEKVEMYVRTPNRLKAVISGTGREREIYYDGKRVTVYGERLGYYARFDAPPTIRQAITAAEENYALEIPLADLFFWGTDQSDLDKVMSAFPVGPARIDDRDCRQYAFSQEDVSWQIWIEEKTNAPCKLLIVDTADEERPQYSAVLEVDKEQFKDGVFVFVPPKTAQEIPIMEVDETNWAGKTGERP